MPRFMVGVAGAAIIVAAVPACSSNKSSTTSTSSSAPGPALGTSSATASATTGAGQTTVIIDGQHQNVQGAVVCSTMGGTVDIAIGQPSSGVGIHAVLSTDNPPVVKAVGLGNHNGSAWGYSPSDPQGSAQATKDGNSYTITGTAYGFDISNPKVRYKSFEIDVTCP